MVGWVALTVLALAGCAPDSSLPTDTHMAMLPVSAVGQASNAQALNDLRRLTAPLHDFSSLGPDYLLFSAPPLTALDGCISDPAAGGMGYHYGRFDNLGDDAINLLDPEFLVYAPVEGGVKGGSAPARLAALEYFIPYSHAWPGPDDVAYSRAPRLSDFSSFDGMPDVAMSPTPFGGWAIHIWLWENNPDGMLMNYNHAVPLCH
jgi:hypothetical protein